MRQCVAIVDKFTWGQTPFVTRVLIATIGFILLASYFLCLYKVSNLPPVLGERDDLFRNGCVVSVLGWSER